jgi:hypothetical protein
MAAPPTTQTFSVHRDQATKIVSGSTLATLLVPDGQWAIFAKMNLDNDTSQVHTVDCKLSAGVDFDQNVARLGPTGLNNTDMAALAFNVVHTFPGESEQPKNAVTLLGVLDTAGANVAASRIKITAIRVASITNKPA